MELCIDYCYLGELVLMSGGAQQVKTGTMTISLKYTPSVSPSLFRISKCNRMTILLLMISLLRILIFPLTSKFLSFNPLCKTNTNPRRLKYQLLLVISKPIEPKAEYFMMLFRNKPMIEKAPILNLTKR